jgi:hypothetical protein
MMGLTMMIDLLFENPPSRAWPGQAHGNAPSWKTEMLLVGVAMGLVGSLVSIQATAGLGKS